MTSISDIVQMNLFFILVSGAYLHKVNYLNYQL